MKPKSNTVIAASVTGAAGDDGVLAVAKAGTPAAAIAAHASHGTYFFLNPIPGPLPLRRTGSHQKLIAQFSTSQRLLHMRGAKPVDQMTAVASISTFAWDSTSAVTSTTAITGKWRPMTARYSAPICFCCAR